MRTTGVLLLVVLLAGCGGDAGAGPKPSPSSSEPAAVTLVDTCPRIEAALPGGVVPPARKWDAYADDLAGFSAQGDTETQNAISVLMPAVEDLADDPAGMELLDARDALLTALDTMADRCAAVGSSALQ